MAEKLKKLSCCLQHLAVCSVSNKKHMHLLFFHDRNVVFHVSWFVSQALIEPLFDVETAHPPCKPMDLLAVRPQPFWGRNITF